MLKDPAITPTNVRSGERRDRTLKRTQHASHTDSTRSPAVSGTVPSLTPAQMYSNFEEWIKMCTDNKVNATNTWNFALIDYFHEMTFIKEGDSINFQKASCTLDGCVKIYTSRIDSVASETGKLLSGLANSSNSTNIEDDNQDNQTERRVRRRTNKSESYLLKDFSSIAIKKFDLDFSIDPLFKKTSADFDEGGARGIDRQCKIIFDASDATVEGDDDEEYERDQAQKKVIDKEEEENDAMEVDRHEDTEDITTGVDGSEQKTACAESRDEMSNTNGQDFNQEENIGLNQEDLNTVHQEMIKDDEDMVEISRLKAKLPTLDILSSLNIVPSLKGYQFFSENDLDIPNLDNDEMTIDNPINPVDEIDYGDMLDFDQGDDYDIGYDGENLDPFTEDTGINDADEGIDNTQKEFPEQDFITAMVNSGEKDLFSYFDKSLSRNWAGPEHWKLRRPIVTNTPAVDENVENNEKPKKKSRQTFEIKFIPSDSEEEGDEEEADIDALFATSKQKIILPKDTAKPSNHLLPDDIHFSSKELLQYFLKPMFPTSGRKKNTREESDVPADNSSEEPDVNFWADQSEGYDMDIDYGEDSTPNMMDNDQTILTAYEDTSFYQDNYENNLEESLLYGDALITNHNLKKSKPMYVNYARTAKRVDVKKLKDNLWRALTVPKNVSGENDTTEISEKVHGTQKFTDIVQNLKRMYPPKAMKDISIPFCFICLLHLANEKDLSIGGTGQDDDFVLGEGDWIHNEAILNEVTISQN
ncbi:condensin complex subunit 2/barren [Pilobolus umbonatus]|nr:condensin complex subunit 2/barren [Pilobolus umbonatus]